MSSWSRSALGAFSLVSLPSLAHAQDAAPAIDSGDNAFLLISAGLVLMMTGPGLALFYGGLARSKNVLSTMMHSFAMMGVVSILWAVYGYGIAFGDGNAFFGNPLSHLMLDGVGALPNADYAGTVPALTFSLYQMMFAIITPALSTSPKGRSKGAWIFGGVCLVPQLAPRGARDKKPPASACPTASAAA